ncbi:MAG TPA: preprotein translocase subunit SecE [Moraxellaceae bacterium]|nr:preprotein translocase subunit SecE [Moraxellaceae bacterium]
MATQVEASGGSSGLNLVKWIVVLLLLVAATLGNHYLTSVSPVVRIGGVVVLALVAFGIALVTTQGRAFIEMLKEARVEARKIVWPSKQETWQTTLIVGGVVVVSSLLLWGIDSLFGWLVSSVIG